jgi:hypothetical protein
MNTANYPVLTQGWPRIGVWLAAALVLAICDCELLAPVALAVAGLLTWNYRNPVRTVSHFEAGAFTSPCDGRVGRVETKENGEIVIEIETGCLDASLLCTPFEAELSEPKIVRGARLGRTSPLREHLNEHGTLRFLNGEGVGVTVTHRLARDSAPLDLGAPGSVSNVVRGTPYGVMTTGTTCITLPAAVRVAVNPGERVRAVETLLGYLG